MATNLSHYTYQSITPNWCLQRLRKSDFESLPSSQQAISVIQKTTTFFVECNGQISKIGRQRFSAEQLFEYVKRPSTTFAPNAASDLNMSVPTARAALEILVQLEMIAITQLDRKQKVYTFQKYLDLLNEVE